MAQLENGRWEPDFPIGSWVELEVEPNINPNKTGIVALITNFDTTDGDYYVVGPDPERDPMRNSYSSVAGWSISEWVPNAAVLRAAHSPLEETRPDHIFMVIRPKRQITTYANLDALLAGMAGDGVATAERDQQVREAAALAIADPGTDIKIPPGASNSPWLRFTQVEGA
jgi:hypothetical protein